MRGLLIFYLTQHFLFDDNSPAASTPPTPPWSIWCRWSAASWPTASWARARRSPSARCCWWPATSPWPSRGRRRTQMLTYHGATLRVPGERPDGRRARSSSRSPASCYDFGQRPRPATSRSRACRPARRCPRVLPKAAYTLTVETARPGLRRRPLPGAGPDHHGRRLPEGQHLLDRRPALSAGRSAARSRASPSTTTASTSGRSGRPILCGYLGQTLRLGAGFGLAGVGMLAGLRGLHARQAAAGGQRRAARSGAGWPSPLSARSTWNG